MGISIVLVIIAIGIYFVFQQKQEQDRDYEIESVTNYQYFVLKATDDQKFGVMDTQGNIKIPTEYTMVKIPNPSKPIFVCQTEGKSMVLNASGEQLYTTYDAIDALQLKNVASDLVYEKSILKYEKGGKYGLLTLEGDVITDPIYEEIDTLQYKEGELLVKQDGKYGVINLKGYPLVESQYDKIQADAFFEEDENYRYDGYIVANKTDNGYRYGYVDYTGKEYLQTIYNDMQRIPDSGERKDVYLLVAENGRYGVFHNEKQLIPNEYQSIHYDSSHAIFIVQQGKQYGVMNREGKQIIDCQFEQLDVKGKYLYAQKGEKTEVYDAEGKLTNISPEITIVTIPEKQEYTIRIQATEEGTTYQICKNEQPVSEESYQYLAYLTKDLFIASKAGENLGIVDIQGNSKSEFKYTSIQVIPNTNLIQRMINNTLEIANEAGEVILQMENGTMTQEETYICVTDGKNKTYITPEGATVTNQEILVNNTLFAMTKDGKWGYADKAGNIVVEPIYDAVTEFNQYGFAGVLKDGKWGMIKQDGTIGLEPSESNVTSQSEPEFISEYHQVQYGSGQIYYTK